MKRTHTTTTGTGAVANAINCGSVDINDPGTIAFSNRLDHYRADFLASDLGGQSSADATTIPAGNPRRVDSDLCVDPRLPAVALSRCETMSAKVEEVAAIKAKILKAVDEVEHGDNSAAIMALAEALSEMLAYIIEKEQQIPVIHPKGEWVKEPEPPAKIKLPKK